MSDLQTLRAGVTIETVLDDFDIPHRHHRAACPIHGGDNRSAFSFNDDTFYCHTHGCRGDVVTLIMALAKTDFKGALDYLARGKGIIDSLCGTRAAESSRQPPGVSDAFKDERKKLAPKDQVELLSAADDLRRTEIELFECKQYIAKLTRRLATLNHLKKIKKLSEPQYYLNTQKIEDDRLAIYDGRATELIYKTKRLKQMILDQRRQVDRK